MLQLPKIIKKTLSVRIGLMVVLAMAILLMASMVVMLYEQYMIDDEKGDSTNDFDMPHYWCASMGNRLDVWHLPASESYAELAGLGCMMFEDNYFDQSFLYASKDDTRTTAPMSYCLTVYNTDTYELLPLLGNRVSVEFIEPQEEETGINTVNGQWSMVNLQRITSTDSVLVKGIRVLL